MESGKRYLLGFRARSNLPRQIDFGLARAYEPWDNLGIYSSARLDRGWQRFEVEFVPTADDDNARILFDLGDSVSYVDLSELTLRCEGIP